MSVIEKNLRPEHDTMSSTSNPINILPDRYKVLQRLGAGGMATVYQAEDTTLNRLVAVKVLHDHLVHDETFRERFEREAQLVANLQHPNIVTIFDYNMTQADDGRYIYYMVMPYLPGKTLADMLHEQHQHNDTLMLPRVRQITLELAAALSYAHGRDMVHRDVKPANIIFDEGNRAILTDFGIARLKNMDGLTQEGLIVGTPAYMSPEQATGDVTDHRADIYALGVILYEMLTGMPPYKDDGTLSLLLKHVNDPIPRVSEFVRLPNAEMDNVIFKALAKRPEDRYQSASEFAADVDAVLSEIKVTPPNFMPLATHQLTNDQSTTTLKPASVAPRPTQLLATITTRVIQPARQNPLGFAALAVALIALLIVARMSQNAPVAAAATPVAASQSVADSMTGDLYFTSNFDEEDEFNASWQQDDTDMLTRDIADGAYILTNNTSGIATTSLFDPTYIYQNVSITMDALLTLDSASSSGYGIVFRYQDMDNYNVFAVDGRGRFSIWVREQGVWRELRAESETWTTQAAILPMGAINHLHLNLSDDHLTGYVNNTEVVTITDATFKKGGIGIYVATPSSGTAQVHVATYSVAQADSPTDSMTDDTAGSDGRANSMTSDEATATSSQ
jgi:serine/threonine protein kinase